MFMTNKEKMEKLLASSDNGVITAKQLTDAGIHRGMLAEYTENGQLTRYGRGLYIKDDVWEDDLYLLQQKYSRGIYSHDTALYLLGYSDRTPARYTMTFPQGYNTPSLKQENLIIKRALPEIYSIGIIEILSPSGNPICIYNLEKTLCDIVRGSGSDIQIVNSAMKRYASNRDRNIHRLLQYADKLRVNTKIKQYMEVLL